MCKRISSSNPCYEASHANCSNCTINHVYDQLITNPLVNHLPVKFVAFIAFVESSLTLYALACRSDTRWHRRHEHPYLVSQCRTKNTHNLMHAQAGSCTNVKQKHDHGHIVSMLRFGPLVFFNLLPFFNAYDACALNCKVSVFVPGSHVRFTAEDVPNEDLPDSASVDTVRFGHGR